jgi:hypothetical protein
MLNPPNGVTVSETVVVAFRLPEVPVMVIVFVPAAAVVLAVKVRTLVEVAGFGLKEAVTPFGNAEVVRVTLPLNPLTGVMVMVLAPLAPPLAMLTDDGAAESVKLWTRGFTVRLTVVVAVMLPEVPVMVTVTVPVVALELADKVSVLVLVVGFGLNAAVTPLGKPEAARVTLPVKPPTSVTVMVLVPLLPCVTLTLLGEAESVNPGCAGPVRKLIRPAPFGDPQPVGKSYPAVVSNGPSPPLVMSWKSLSYADDRPNG